MYAAVMLDSGNKTLKRELECPGNGMMDVVDIVLEEDKVLLDEAVVAAGVKMSSW